jgi:hypothetical protein
MMNSVDPPPMSTTSCRVLRVGQGMGHAQVNQAGLFAAGDDFDRKAQCRFGLGQELGAILGHAQGIGGDGTHRARLEAAQALAESGPGRQCRATGKDRPGFLSALSPAARRLPAP